MGTHPRILPRLPAMVWAILLAVGCVALVAGVRWLGPLRDSSTKVMRYTPPPALVARLAPDARAGTCWTRSIAASGRSDAWRCMVGNAIADPCFEAQSTPGGTQYLVCDANPAAPAAAHPFVLRLSRPLPHEPAPSAREKQQAAGGGWLVKLADGRLCRPFTGTRPFTSTGVVADYGCTPLKPDDPPAYIFDGLNRNPRTWTAKAGTLRQVGRRLPSLRSAKTVPIAEVWQ